jgi:hypothetical protein
MPVTTRINLSNQERAVQAAVTRTVQSMSLSMKDGVLGALKSNIDRPTPFTLLPKAYQAGKPTVVDGVITSRFSIAQVQSAYLRFAFFGGTRKPGDPGTAQDKMFTPVRGNPASTDQYGGLPRGFVKKMLKKRTPKESDLVRSAFGSGRGKAAGDGRYGQGGVFMGKVKIHGREEWGVWQRPKRTRKAADDKINRRKGANGAPVARGLRDAHGRFIATGLSTAGTKKNRDLRVRNVGGLKLLVASKRVTHYRARIDYGRLAIQAQRQAASQHGQSRESRKPENIFWWRGWRMSEPWSAVRLESEPHSFRE